MAQTRGHLLKKGRDDVMANGAVILGSKQLVLYEYLEDKAFGYPTTIATDDVAGVIAAIIKVKLYSPWLPELDTVVYRLRESGLVEKFLHMHLPLEAITPRKKKNDLKPVDVTLLLTPLFFLCTGLTGTVLLFIGEIFRSRLFSACLLYTSPSPRDRQKSRMPSSA